MVFVAGGQIQTGGERRIHVDDLNALFLHDLLGEAVDAQDHRILVAQGRDRLAGLGAAGGVRGRLFGGPCGSFFSPYAHQQLKRNQWSLTEGPGVHPKL